MYSHVFVSVGDFDRALRFYEPVMAALGLEARFCERDKPWAGWQSAGKSRPFFVICHPYDGQAHAPGNGQMVAFAAADRATVARVHTAALAHGGRCEGAPGLRPHYHAHYWGAYFRDPDGNKFGVACHTAPDAAGNDAFPTLETERLILREIIQSDAPALFAVHGDADSMRWFGNDPLPNLAGASELVERFASWRRQPNPGTRWGIQRKGSPELIGTCGLFGWNRASRKCVLGYELHPDARGRGYMAEALAAVVPWGFAHMDLNRIEAQVHPDNAASIRSVERLGFQREGVARQWGFWGGRFHDMSVWALLRQDWAARAEARIAP